MAIVCGYCGASMPDISEYCPACGRPVREGTYFAPEASGAEVEPADDILQADAEDREVLPTVEWNDRMVSAFAYLTFIPAVVFLFVKKYRERTFVRFHSFQSIFFWAAVLVLVLLGLLASKFGWPFVWLIIGALVFLGLFFTWIVLS